MDFLFVNVAHADVNSFIGNVNDQIVNPLIQLLFAIALVVFVWGVFQFLSNPEKEDERTKGKSHMMWGIVGLVIMLGIWGILSLIIDTLDIEGIDPEAETVEGTVELEDYTPSAPQVGN